MNTVGIARTQNVERVPMEVPQEVKENIKSMNYIVDENNNVSIEIEYQGNMSLEDKALLNMCIAESFKQGLKQAHDEDILRIIDDIEIKVKGVEK